MLTKKDLLDALEPINTRLGRLEQGQQSLETGQNSLMKQVQSLEDGQKSLIVEQQSITDEQRSLTEGQRSLTEGQKSLETRLERIEKKLDVSIQDNADLFNQTWIHLDEIQTLIEKRMKKIEDHLNFPQN